MGRTRYPKRGLGMRPLWLNLERDLWLAFSDSSEPVHWSLFVQPFAPKSKMSSIGAGVSRFVFILSSLNWYLEILVVVYEQKLSCMNRPRCYHRFYIRSHMLIFMYRYVGEIYIVIDPTRSTLIKVFNSRELQLIQIKSSPIQSKLFSKVTRL